MAVRCLIFLLIGFFLQGCASSSVQREAANQVDGGVGNATAMASGDGNIADAYQNSSQAIKGVLIGGAAGALIGNAIPGIGPVTGLASGAIAGGAYGTYIDSYTSLQDQLENRNVRIIILGDQIRLVMLSSQVFESSVSSTIRPSAFSTLDLVTQFINQYPNVSVQVSAHTNVLGSERVNQALTQQQAESITRYLWRTRINTRLLYASGYGSSQLVTKADPTQYGESDNDRVEITLEKVPV
jgi:outer membrane protein OmpA-like peptidoglycan-associated protein